jgi:hypothetical protein
MKQCKVRYTFLSNVRQKATQKLNHLPFCVQQIEVRDSDEGNPMILREQIAVEERPEKVIASGEEGV